VILGIGIDLVDVARFSRIAARHDPGFLESLFPPAEIAWCGRRRRRDEHLAARFAAREAALNERLVARDAQIAEQRAQLTAAEAAAVEARRQVLELRSTQAELRTMLEKEREAAQEKLGSCLLDGTDRVR
jgi:phosphopantetheine--protein transferase-like protein